MKPQVVGSACHRLQAALDEAMSEGVLDLAPELTAHAARCARCSVELKETEALLGRLRNASAGIDLSRVPHVVDYVLSQTAIETTAPTVSLDEKRRQKQVRLRWVLTQVAAVAAVLLIAVTGLTYTVLKVNEVVSGVKPTEVLAKLAAPFSSTQKAEFHGNAK